jgi:hypothetical protein
MAKEDAAAPIASVAPADGAIVVPVVPLVELIIDIVVVGRAQVIAPVAVNVPAASTAMIVGVAFASAPATVWHGTLQSVHALALLPDPAATK